MKRGRKEERKRGEEERKRGRHTKHMPSAHTHTTEEGWKRGRDKGRNRERE
jgi:hypothetical protein